jgi:hypothetical protein
MDLLWKKMNRITKARRDELMSGNESGVAALNRNGCHCEKDSGNEIGRGPPPLRRSFDQCLIGCNCIPSNTL